MVVEWWRKPKQRKSFEVVDFLVKPSRRHVKVGLHQKLVATVVAVAVAATTRRGEGRMIEIYIERETIGVAEGFGAVGGGGGNKRGEDDI